MALAEYKHHSPRGQGTGRAGEGEHEVCCAKFWTNPPHHGAHLGVLAEPGAVKGWPGAPSSSSAGVQSLAPAVLLSGSSQLRPWRRCGKRRRRRRRSQWRWTTGGWGGRTTGSLHADWRRSAALPPSSTSFSSSKRRKGKEKRKKKRVRLLAILLTCSSHLQPLVLCLCDLRCTFPTRPFPFILVGRFKIR